MPRPWYEYKYRVSVWEGRRFAVDYVDRPEMAPYTVKLLKEKHGFRDPNFVVVEQRVVKKGRWSELR